MALEIGRRFGKDRFELVVEGVSSTDDLYRLYLDAGGTDYKDRVDEMQNDLDREGERIEGLNAQIERLQDTVADLESKVRDLSLGGAE